MYQYIPAGLRQLLNVDMTPLYFETNYNMTISYAASLSEKVYWPGVFITLCYWLVEGISTTASCNHIVRIWRKFNKNSLGLQCREKCQWRGREFTHVLKECPSSRELTQCNNSMRVVDSDRCGMTAIPGPPAPVKTHPFLPHALHTACQLPVLSCQWGYDIMHTHNATPAKWIWH